MEALRKKEREDETQFTTKIGGKTLVCVPVISFCKIFISVEALQKKERQDETQFTTKIGGKTSLDPSYFVL